MYRNAYKREEKQTMIDTHWSDMIVQRSDSDITVGVSHFTSSSFLSFWFVTALRILYIYFHIKVVSRMLPAAIVWLTSGNTTIVCCDD